LCVSSRRRSSKVVRPPWLRKLASVVVVFSGVWFLSVLVLRVVNPPFTPLMAIRAIEYSWEGKDIIRGWEWAPLSDIPIHVQRAVIAAEDARYLQHWGIDLSEVGDALEDGGGKKRLRGASTITMQTVKNVFLWPGRSYVRKVIEAGMALVAGAVWGKRRTLELYLNVIEWGEGVYGIEAAARHHFGKGVHNLTMSEASALAAILPSPRSTSPQTLSGVARRRYTRILREAHAVPVPASFGG
jgi:monofunctional biosynthetic peptidoglycan transglycosylase